MSRTVPPASQTRSSEEPRASRRAAAAERVLAAGRITTSTFAEPAGVVRSAEFQPAPGPSAGVLIVDHPEARYFSA